MPWEGCRTVIRAFLDTQWGHQWSYFTHSEFHGIYHSGTLDRWCLSVPCGFVIVSETRKANYGKNEEWFYSWDWLWRMPGYKVANYVDYKCTNNVYYLIITHIKPWSRRLTSCVTYGGSTTVSYNKITCNGTPSFCQDLSKSYPEPLPYLSQLRINDCLIIVPVCVIVGKFYIAIDNSFRGICLVYSITICQYMHVHKKLSYLPWHHFPTDAASQCVRQISPRLSELACRRQCLCLCMQVKIVKKRAGLIGLLRHFW